MEPELLDPGVVLVSELAGGYELEKLAELARCSQELGNHAVLVDVGVYLVQLRFLDLVHLIAD